MASRCRDETLEALSDARNVAPAVQTADLHSADHRNSFLYVFDYQTKFGDFPQVSGPADKGETFVGDWVYGGRTE